jgi:hypothetical protein
MVGGIRFAGQPDDGNRSLLKQPKLRIEELRSGRRSGSGVEDVACKKYEIDLFCQCRGDNPLSGPVGGVEQEVP